MHPHPSPSRIASWACVCALAGVLTAVSFEARSDDGSASGYAKRAQVAYDLQDWPTAIEAFGVAYQLEQKPEYLWGLAQAQRLGGDCASAILSYKAFKRSDGVTTTQGTAAELQIMKCEAEIAKKEAEDAKAASSAAPAASASVASTVTPEPPMPVKPPTDEVKPFYADALGDVLLVSGVGALGVGTYFLLKGNSDMHAAESAPSYGAYDRDVDSASTKQKIGVVTLGAGGVLVGFAIIRYLTLGPPKSGDQPTGLVVAPTTVGWSVGWVGAF